MCLDYFKMVHLYTDLEVYLIIEIKTFVVNLNMDDKVLLCNDGKLVTALAANVCLYQFVYIFFVINDGMKNLSVCYWQISLMKRTSWIYSLFIAGRDQLEYYKCVLIFFKAAQVWCLIWNVSKSIHLVRKYNLIMTSHNFSKRSLGCNHFLILR